ncbi:MAG: flippase-like domain-containing protein [Clostridia bacterium]|nr:flippase-like domain-containing protein [Clostridia bacterium]
MKKPSRQTRSNILNALVIFGTVLIVIWLAVRNSDVDASLKAIREADGLWLLAGLGLWFSSIMIEALVNQCFFIWQRIKIRYFSTLHITLIGMFYSNVTPAATGGQPMQVFAFKNRGVPVGVSSSSLAVKFFCFQFALLTGGAVLWLTQQPAVNACVGDAKWMIFAGFAINGLSVALVLLLAINRNIVRALIIFLLRLGQKLRLIKDLARSSSRADAALNDFSASVDMLVHHPMQILFLLLLSWLQLFMLMSASCCVYRALHMQGHSPLLLMTLQWLLFIAASFTPLPGASGVQEGGFYLLYESIFPRDLQFPALLLWRAVTYYMALIIGLGSVIFESVRSMRRNKQAHNHQGGE